MEKEAMQRRTEVPQLYSQMPRAEVTQLVLLEAEAC